MPITHWHLQCLIFGNMWYLLCAIKIQDNQPGLKLPCSDNTLLLCSGDENQVCIDTSLCKAASTETQGNKSTGDPLKSLRDALCNDQLSNCSFTNNGNYKCNFGEHQNSSVILKITDCWRENFKATNLTSEFIFSIIVFLSIITMFLSYICLRKTLSQSVTRKQNTLFYVKCNQPKKAELV